MDKEQAFNQFWSELMELNALETFKNEYISQFENLPETQIAYINK